MREIQLTQGYITQVDDDLFEELNNFKWFVLATHHTIRYAARWIRGTKPRQTLRMHHTILRIKPDFLMARGLVVDHFDRDGLNNQRVNLRIATRRENILNSEYCDNALGIYWNDQRLKWTAFVLHPKKEYVGMFDNLDDAIKAQSERHASNQNRLNEAGGPKSTGEGVGL